jgi:NAD(P)-dependent dehydrogenase (short-subunit alcohol dehydrogenase family)
VEHDDLAVVTGGASGVGARTVAGLLERGTAVVSLDRAWPDAEVPLGLTRVAGDVTSVAAWADVAAAIAAHPAGAPSKLVINAAHLVVGTVLSLAEEDFRQVLEVNVLGAVKALQTCLPSMIERGRGSIVTVASVDALFAEQGLAAYCSSKGALVQLTRCVAVDHARQGIRANAVCPGAIDTPFFRRHVEAAPDPAAFLAEKVERHPSGRILQPEDVAATVLHLLSDAAIGMNGATLVLDGGLTASFDYQATAPA